MIFHLCCRALRIGVSRRFDGRSLKRFGYKVTAFTHPSEALTTFKGDPQAFDILITDMTMPEIIGETFPLECLAIRPELPVVLCSGFSKTIDKA